MPAVLQYFSADGPNVGQTFCRFLCKHSESVCVALSARCHSGSSAIPIQEILEDPQIRGWLIRVHAHETGLYRHTVRVARLVTEYTRFVGIPYPSAWTMIEGGLLHDVGKILMPAAMLVKPKPLNEAEKQMMTLHPAIGAALLEVQGYFEPPAIAVVRSHHERLDGSGYPEGLRHTTTKAVRVVAVCDAFCAMTESRPYEGAWPEEAALKRLQSMPGQYDAEIALSLGSVLEAKRQGWKPDNMEFDLGSELTAKGHRRVGLVHPRSAFFERVYPSKSAVLAAAGASDEMADKPSDSVLI